MVSSECSEGRGFNCGDIRCLASVVAGCSYAETFGKGVRRIVETGHMEFWQRHCGCEDFGSAKLEHESTPIALGHLSAIMLSVIVVLTLSGIGVLLLELVCDRIIR